MPDEILIRTRTWAACREMGRASLLIPISAKLTRAIKRELSPDLRMEFETGEREAAHFLNGHDDDNPA